MSKVFSSSNSGSSVAGFSSNNGYLSDLFLLSEDQLNSITCSICTEICSEALITDNAGDVNSNNTDSDPCGHSFCSKCIQSWLLHNSDCPQCRKSLTSKQLRPDMITRRLVNNSRIQCSNYTSGCKWQNEFGKEGANLIQHRNTICEYELINCNYVNEGCKLTCTRSKIINHQLLCEYRSIECQYCSIIIKPINQVLHYQDCANYPIQCSQRCNMSISRNELIVHQRDDCINTITQCPYFNNGCLINLLRKEISIHSELCKYRSFNCQYCNIILISGLNEQKLIQEKHQSECKENPIHCSNQCGSIVSKSKLQLHLDNDCPNTMIQCKYVNRGCVELIKRSKLVEHLNQSSITHLELIERCLSITENRYNSIESRLVSLENKSQQQPKPKPILENSSSMGPSFLELMNLPIQVYYNDKLEAGTVRNFNRETGEYYIEYTCGDFIWHTLNNKFIGIVDKIANIWVHYRVSISRPIAEIRFKLGIDRVDILDSDNQWRRAVIQGICVRRSRVLIQYYNNQTDLSNTAQYAGYLKNVPSIIAGLIQTLNNYRPNEAENVKWTRHHIKQTIVALVKLIPQLQLIIFSTKFQILLTEMDSEKLTIPETIIRLKSLIEFSDIFQLADNSLNFEWIPLDSERLQPLHSKTISANDPYWNNNCNNNIISVNPTICSSST